MGSSSDDVLRTAADVEAALDPSVVLLYAAERPLLLHDAAAIRKAPQRRRRPLGALVLDGGRGASLERRLRLVNARLARPPRHRPAPAAS